MADVKGFKIIRVGTTSTTLIACEAGMIEYTPKLKYRIEKKNAFDPTYVHQREPYHEDSFKLDMAITPDLYRSLLTILGADGAFYLIYTSASETKQFLISFDSLPKCSDDLHEYPDITSMSCVSRYLNYSPVVNTEVEEMTAFDETIIIG